MLTRRRLFALGAAAPMVAAMPHRSWYFTDLMAGYCDLFGNYGAFGVVDQAAAAGSAIPGGGAPLINLLTATFKLDDAPPVEDQPCSSPPES